MSVLIKMEMPTRCMDCPFMVSRDNDDCILQSAEANESFENWEQMRAGCPLIPVPPHGRLIDADALIEDLNLLLEETQTKTGCSFCDDVSYGEVLSCIEGQDIEYPFTEQDVRETFNNGYSCGMENKDGWVPVVRCIDCKYAEIRKLFGLDIPFCKVENNVEQAKRPSHYCGYGEKRDEGQS